MTYTYNTNNSWKMLMCTVLVLELHGIIEGITHWSVEHQTIIIRGFVQKNLQIELRQYEDELSGEVSATSSAVEEAIVAMYTPR